MKILSLAFAGLIVLGFLACGHPKPKPISRDITKTAVSVNGKKDSVINNPEKNYGNATVSEPCVKCLLTVIGATDTYKKLTSGLPAKNIIYDVNWITSTKPVSMDNGVKIVNGMAIAVNVKESGKPKKLSTYLYNNESALLYLQNNMNNTDKGLTVADSSLKKIPAIAVFGASPRPNN